MDNTDPGQPVNTDIRISEYESDVGINTTNINLNTSTSIKTNISSSTDLSASLDSNPYLSPIENVGV
jgi:hypothetical protein